MPIDWDPVARQFHLRNERLSYVLCVLEDGSLGHMYLGVPLAPDRPYRHLVPGVFRGFSNRLGDPVPFEYPTAGIGDFRIPALEVVHADGSTAVRLGYTGHRVLPGKPALPGLPATYVEDDAEADTLEVDLDDAPSGLEVTLRYSLLRDHAAIARSATIRNGGDRPVFLSTAMSLSLDLPDAAWDMTTLSGTGVRERHLVTRRLVHGRQSVSSRRGQSSHEHNPFLVFSRPDATEPTGEALGISLVYSGNFLAEAEVDAWDSTRIRMGIDPDDFRWTVEPGSDFTTPEAVLVWSSGGVGGVSDAFHALYRERLARGAWRDRPRPVVINNWEATYFGFDEARLLELAASAAAVGIELFVLDDGWFGERDDDTSSLGDWVVDGRKLPNGLGGLARSIEALGMRFGIWIEPEMVSRRSRLFETYPDWAVGIPGRERTESRNQYVLDLTRREVVDHLVAAISDVLASAPIAYVKWDMNRSITEPWTPSLPPDRQGEFFHRHVLGLYELWRRVTEAFPDVLFESCAGGGGRFDPGLLAFAPQTWTSDDTDAIERLRIQWGTSMVYPLSATAAHVSAVPNHQVGRITPLATRAAVAFFGAFGYELDLTALEPDQLDQVAEQVRFYKEQRELFQFGRFARLVSPFEGDGNETAWMAVSNDRRRAIVGWYRVLNRPAPGPTRVRLRGLDPEARYRITLWPEPDDDAVLDGVDVRGGDELMAAGLIPGPFLRDSAGLGDFAARLFILDAVPDGS